MTEVLRPALPDTIGISTNVAMVDHAGGQSPEIDVVVFDRTSLPPLVYGNSTKVLPVEACIYAIEVKTRLTSTEVKDALAKAERIASLDYVSELKVQDRPRSRVLPALFGFASDLTGDPADEVTRVTKNRPKTRYPEIAWIDGKWWTSEAPALKVLCVAGRCYAYRTLQRDPETGAPGEYMWHMWPSNADPYDEVMAFVGGLANTVTVEAAARKGLFFGDYLISPE